jgi:TonB family protein
MTWWHYLLLANVYLTLFFVFYALFLRRETFFNLNRVYLVSSAIFSFMIPVIQSDWIKNLFITKKVQQTIYQVGPAVMQSISAHTTPNHQLTIGQILCGIYISGILVLTFRFFYQLAVINWVINQARSETTYSFFNRIKIEERDCDNDVITVHEEAHARHWHSVDVLLLEAIMIINWFNPVVYLYRNAVKHIHEFIADRDVLKAGTNKAEYAMLLLSQTFVTPPYHLVNPFFNSSLLKQRIQMLHRNKSHMAMLVKYGLSAPLFALMLVLSSATVNNSKTLQVINSTVQQAFVTPAAQSFNGGNLSDADKKDLNDAIKANQLAASAAQQQNPLPIATVSPDDKKTTTSVQHTASYPGGIAAFYQYLSANTLYPQDARQKNIQGRVYATFIVEKDGTITDIKILHGVSTDVDEEALRVLSNMPKWEPGVQNGLLVRQQYTVPISFTLSDGNFDILKDTANRLTYRLKNVTTAPILERNTADTARMEARSITQVKSQPKQVLLTDGKVGNVILANKTTETGLKAVNAVKDNAAKSMFGEKATTGIVQIVTKHKPFFFQEDITN